MTWLADLLNDRARRRRARARRPVWQWRVRIVRAPFDWAREGDL